MKIKMRTFADRNLPGTFITLILALALGSCAASDSGPYPAAGSAVGARVQACKAGDTQVASVSDCIQDDAACYQISNGQWCTGERGASCPAGSVQMNKDSVCPAGSRCFEPNEGLKCAITFN